MKYEMPNPVIEGWMSPDELSWIYDRACEMESIVEIGGWFGRSTHAMCLGCKGTVWSVDHFKGSPNELHSAHKPATERDISVDFFKNVGHFKNLRQLRMYSVDAARLFEPKSVDMVFIDGCHIHEDALADLRAWYPIAKKIVCGHDYKSVERALAEFGFPHPAIPVATIWVLPRIDV
jgi:hypothetical protein